MESQNKKLKVLDTNEAQSANLDTSNTLPVLNDDCLFHIFSFLPIEERIKIQRVCKRWQAVGTIPWQDMKKLDLKPSRWSIIEKNVYLTHQKLKQVIRLCGPCLIEIDFTIRKVPMSEFRKRRFNIDENFAAFLKEHCPNIRIMNLIDTYITQTAFMYLADNFRNISDISLTSLTQLRLDESAMIAYFFVNNKNLRFIKLNWVRLSGKTFMYLPAQTIEEISIIACAISEFQYFYQALQRFHKLNTFKLEHTKSTDNDHKEIFYSLAGNSNLKTLVIANYHLRRAEFNVQPCFAAFRNLEMLKLSGEYMARDDVMIHISQNCKNLTSIKFKYSEDLTDASLIPILSLPKLQYVSLTEIDNITNKILFTAMPELKSLKCNSCYNLERSGFRAVVETSTNIECLKVYGCKKICSEKLIEDVTQIIQNRKRNVKLQLRVLSKVESAEIDVSPYLHVEKRQIISRE